MGVSNVLHIPLPANVGGTGVVSPAPYGVMTSQGASAMIPINLTDGQLVVGSTGAQPIAANITQQDGVSITNGAGSIAVTTVPNAKASMPFNFMMMGG